MTNVFLGEPPAHIKNWMLTHTPYVYFGSVDGTHQHRTNVTELTGSYNWDNNENTGSQTCLVGNESVSNNNITYLSGDAACKCTSVGIQAFDRCQSLTSVSLPAVSSVGSYAFSRCESLTSVSLPAATDVGGGAFYNCQSLTSVSLNLMTQTQIEQSAENWMLGTDGYTSWPVNIHCADGDFVLHQV